MFSVVLGRLLRGGRFSWAFRGGWNGNCDRFWRNTDEKAVISFIQIGTLLPMILLLRRPTHPVVSPAPVSLARYRTFRQVYLVPSFALFIAGIAILFCGIYSLFFYVRSPPVPSPNFG